MNESILANKKAVIDEISTKINNAETVVLFEYQGLSVADFEILRSQLRSEGVEVKIYKNRLTKIAAKETGHDGLNDELTGPNAIAFSNEDAVAGPRIISKFAKDHDVIKIKNGIVEGAVVNDEVIKELASLPSRDGLLSMLLSCLQAPARDMAMIVDAMAKKVEETGSENAAGIIGLKNTSDEVTSEEN
ncbi:MAG: 50S ribosomal protein L10 [Bacilli bacterium]|jgi:large subunit ribosomal protein L10|nr:50S ribosomal protein L10 [Bacilli bacterium]